MAVAERGCVLALDVGTSSCRASLYDLGGRAVRGRFAQITYSPTVTADGGAELDANVLLDRVRRVIADVLAGELPGPIVAVATATFWHSLLGLDASGRPLTPIYPWLDGRSRTELPALRQRLDQRVVHARTGCVLHWTYWPAKLAWLRRTQPETYRSVKRWVGFGEYLLARMTGRLVASISMASGTGLLDIHRCAWDDDVLDAIAVDRRTLPLVGDPAERVPGDTTTTTRWPSLRGVPWLAAIGDGASSNIGAGCTTARDVAIMIGTSGAERVVWAPGGPFTVPWGTWCYRVDDTRIVIGGALNDGGALIDWLHHALRMPRQRHVDRLLAACPADRHGLTVLPFWGGERSPHWSDDARGAIVGLRLNTSPLDIARACMEAVALRFGEIDRLVQQATSGPGEVIGTGGALLHSPTWLQIMADVLERPVLASAEKEATSRGVSLLALERLGLLPEAVEHIRPAARQRYAPRSDHAEIYRRAAERQRRLYDALVT